MSRFSRRHSGYLPSSNSVNFLTLTVNDRLKKTAKYRDVLKGLEDQYASDNEEDNREQENEAEIKDEETEGEGIKFLPGDINGLLDHLKLLYAERHAGNIISTTSEIVAILDELLRKKQITRQQYNAACKELSC